MGVNVNKQPFYEAFELTCLVLRRQISFFVIRLLLKTFFCFSIKDSWFLRIQKEDFIYTKNRIKL